MSVARQHQVIDLALATRAQIDHFADIGKMVGYGVPRNLARCFGLGNHIQKVVPLRVAQQVLNVACQPKLDAAIGLLGVTFKRRGQRINEFGFHALSFCNAFAIRGSGLTLYGDITGDIKFVEKHANNRLFVRFTNEIRF